MPAITSHPLASSRFGNLMRLFRRYGCDRAYLPHASAIAALCLLRQPAIAYERLRFAKRIAAVHPRPDPVFIIGHWRSGTTHLQNILGHDPQFASVTIREAAMPHDFLTLGKRFARIIEKAVPEKRLMDNVAVAADSPWEEELALVASGPLAFYHVSFFPHDMERIFREAVLFDNGDPDLVARWRNDYLHFLKKVTLVRPDRPFLLKNPANTTRIRHLLRDFPEARFIHIHRDPYQVFRSTVHLYLKAQEAWGFHRPDRQAIVEHVLQTYPRFMEAYCAQKEAIPPGRLADVRFDQLEARPMEALESVYREAGISGFAQAKPHFERYLRSIRDYEKNPHTLPPEEQSLVREHWGEWFGRLGYEP